MIELQHSTELAKDIHGVSYLPGNIDFDMYAF